MTTSTLVSGALGHAPEAAASCVSLSGYSLGYGCKSAPASLAIGVGPKAKAETVRPLTFALNNGWKISTSGPKSGPGDDPFEGVGEALARALNDLLSPPSHGSGKVGDKTKAADHKPRCRCKPAGRQGIDGEKTADEKKAAQDKAAQDAAAKKAAEDKAAQDAAAKKAADDEGQQGKVAQAAMDYAAAVKNQDDAEARFDRALKAYNDPAISGRQGGQTNAEYLERMRPYQEEVTAAGMARNRARDATERAKKLLDLVKSQVAAAAPASGNTAPATSVPESRAADDAEEARSMPEADSANAPHDSATTRSSDTAKAGGVSAEDEVVDGVANKVDEKATDAQAARNEFFEDRDTKAKAAQDAANANFERDEKKNKAEKEV